MRSFDGGFINWLEETEEIAPKSTLGSLQGRILRAAEEIEALDLRQTRIQDSLRRALSTRSQGGAQIVLRRLRLTLEKELQ